MSSFIPLPPTYAVSDPQVRAILDVLTRNMQVVIEGSGGTTTNTALATVGGASSFGSANTSTNITNLAPSYTLDTLTADLKRGAAEVITGALNGTTIMKLEPAGQYVVFQHKDAIVLGNTGAYSGTVRTALGITSTGILGGYNRQSDGAWQTTFAIESATGNLTLLGELRANSVVNVGAYLGSQTVSSVLSDVATASADAAAAQAAVANKLNKNAADILSGGITFSSAGGFKTGTISIDGSGNATGDGVAFTSKGIVGRTSAGTTFTLDATTGAATFKGDITGGANIGITGSATFDGYTNAGGTGYAIVVNASGAQTGGGWFNAGTSGRAVSANGGSGKIGVYTHGNGGNGLEAYSFGGSAYAIRAEHAFAAPALYISNGTIRWGVYDIAAPVGSTSAFLRNDGQWATPSGGSGTVTSVSGTGSVSGLTLSGTVTTSGSLTLGGTLSLTSGNVTGALGYTPLSTSGQAYDTARMDGYAASSWARIFPTNSGTANAGGSGLNLFGSSSTGIAGAYVGTTGSGNTVTFDVRTTSPSDLRLKEEVTDIDVGLAFVKQLRPVSYKLKADPKHQKGYGFIAQEVETLIPNPSSLVYEEPDWKVGDEIGFKTIHYPSYIAVLTKAIQELTAKVEALEAKVP